HFEQGVVAGGKLYRKGKEDQPEALPATPEIKRGPLAEGSGEGHFRNFIAAVRSRQVSDLNADILEGHYSAALCHLANISYRLGESTPYSDKIKAFGDDDTYEAVSRMEEHLKANDLKLSDLTFRVGPKLMVDAKAESVVGLLAVRRVLRTWDLLECHDVGGYLLSVVGTLYAVILGLIVVDSMGKFQQARATVEQESNSLADIILLSNQLPRRERDEIR